MQWKHLLKEILLRSRERLSPERLWSAIGLTTSLATGPKSVGHRTPLEGDKKMTVIGTIPSN